MKFLIFVLLLMSCSDQKNRGLELCQQYCGDAGQGYVDLLYMGGGACICENPTGKEIMRGACIEWNGPKSKDLCNKIYK
jgi:hypothetical protein